MALERVKGEIVEQFDGKCVSIEVVPDQLNEGQEQYHLQLQPDDKEMLKDSKTGRFHVWLRITRKSSDKAVAEGSKLDMYLKEIETVVKEAKKATTVMDVLKTMEDKHIRFVRKVLGRSYRGHEARPDFVPREVLD